MCRFEPVCLVVFHSIQGLNSKAEASKYLYTALSLCNILVDFRRSYNIDQHDYSVRLRAARKFLNDGDKVAEIF